LEEKFITFFPDFSKSVLVLCDYLSTVLEKIRKSP